MDDVQSIRGGLRQHARQMLAIATRDLNDIINQLRAFDSDKLFDDPKQLALLQAAALERL